LEPLDTALIWTLLLAGVSGLLVGAGAIAVGAQFPLKALGAGGAPGDGQSIVAVVALVWLLVTALLLLGWIFFGPSNWAPKLIAAGLGFLAGPPISQVLPGSGLEGRPGLLILLALLLVPGIALGLALLG